MKLSFQIMILANLFNKYAKIMVTVILYIVQQRFARNIIIINTVYLNLKGFYQYPFNLNIAQKIEFLWTSLVYKSKIST